MKNDIHAFAEEQKINLTRVTDVSAGVCPLGPSNRVKAAVRRAAKDIDLPADRDCRRLRTYFRSKFRIEKDCILFANSGRELLYRCGQALRPGKVLSAAPVIPPEWMPPAGGADREAADTGGKRITVPKQLGSGDLLIVSNPDRITGRLSGREDLQDVVDAAAAGGAVVVLDEALVEFTRDGRFPQDAGMSDNLIIVRTTANFYGIPGLELAYAVSSPRTIAKLRDVFPPDLNHLAIEAAAAALKDRTYIRAAQEFIRQERREFFASLRKIDGLTVFPSDSNVFLIKVALHREAILGRLSRAGFFIQDCSDIEGLDDSYLRMSVMSHDKNRKCVRILKEVAGKPAG